MKLLCSPTSPFVRMVRVLAHELGQPLELVAVEGLLPTSPHAELVRANPLGKLPCLITDHGSALFDSRVILEYLLHHAGNHTLLPDEPVARFRVLTLLALAQGMCDAGVQLRYETFARPEGLRWPEYAARQRQRMLDAAAHARDYAPFNLGSIGLAAALAYCDFRFPEVDWRAANPALAAWFAETSERPSMQATKF